MYVSIPRHTNTLFQCDYAAALALFPTGGVTSSADVPEALAVYRVYIYIYTYICI